MSETLHHQCPVPGCTKSVEARMLMCREHWAICPPTLKAQVLSHFKPGQTAATATSGYHAAMSKAITAVERRLAIETNEKRQGQLL